MLDKEFWKKKKSNIVSMNDYFWMKIWDFCI